MIPLATTTITVRQPDVTTDPYEQATSTLVVAGQPAHIGQPTGAERQAGGQQEHVDAVLLCNPIAGLDHTCLITDDHTAETWQVTWVRRRRGFGLDHMRAGLVAVSGGAHV